MRLYVSILAVAALSTTACGKKAPPAEPAKTSEPAKKDEPKKEEPAAKKDEPKKEEPTAKVDDPSMKKEEPKKEEPTAMAPVDHAEGMQKGLEAWSAGKFDEAAANFADDVVVYNVGDPKDAEVHGKAAVIEGWKQMSANMTDTKIKASRIILTKDATITELVLSGNVKTKGADGAEVVKPVAVTAATVSTYNADGKVATMWHFMDTASLLMQAGVIPGLPAGFVAPTLPETTEVIKGEPNAALAATYKAFGDKMKPDTIDAAVAELIADDYKSVDSHSGKTLTKADLAGYMKGWMDMFQPESMTTDKEFSAGEYYVAVTTNVGTYKKGIEGAKPDTKVTTHELSVSHIVDGKFKSYDGFMNGLEVAAQLGLMGGAAEKPADGTAPAADGDKLGVAECDLYLTKMRECLTALPDAAKGAYETGMKTALDGWKQSITAGGDAAKTALAGACKTTLDAAKQAAGQLCPAVKWE